MKDILVIDDSPLVSRLLKEALSHAGYEVHIAMDANEGYMAAIEYRPDLILLDVQLPDVTGFELIRVIKNREEIRHIPIIMITGSAHRTEEKVKGFQLGADDYVMKPFEIPELLERIQAILRRSERSAPVQVSAASAESASATDAAAEATGAASPTETVSLNLGECVQRVLLKPSEFPEDIVYPSMGRLYLIIAVLLSLLGLGLSAGGALRPIPGALLVAGIWMIIVSILVIANSIAGIPMTWKQGAAIVSLAGIPMLLKLVGGCLLALVTTLSPFAFTASPALFTGPGWVGLRRLDVFEIWSGLLLWILLRKHAHSDDRKARWLTALVWVSGILVAVAFEKWGVGL